ncbi:MAG: molecular chaperone DnaJ [Deferribacteraceae bacterium]|nr:molecular chaperone DnaJ [Deferribacteraceae bacterium]
MAIDYYAVLGVERTAAEADIKKAYRALALKYHPDRNQGDKEAEAKFKEATVAYQVLSDPQKRAHYDRFGSYEENASGGGAGGFDFSGSFFDDLFGDAFGSMFGGGGGGRQEMNRPRKGTNISASRKISFEESIFGTELELTVNKQTLCGTCSGSGAAPSGTEDCATCRGSGKFTQRQGFFTIQTSCPTCGGLGKIIKEKCNECSGAGYQKEEKLLNVKVPAGIEDSMAIRVGGAGNDGMNGGPAGDLIVNISVKPHKLYTREGNDLIVDLPLTFIDAIMGKDFEIPSLTEGEKIAFSVKAGTQFGDNIVMRGKGAPDVHGRGKGNLIIDLNIMLPTNLNDAQREAIKKVAELSDDKMYDKNKSLWQKMKELFS